jgi:hypothetical protein
VIHEKVALLARDLIARGLPTAGLTQSKKLKYLERETGFEPATTCLEGRSSTTELLPLEGVFRPQPRL